MINVVGFLGFEHQAITHLTGTTSLLAASVAHSEWIKVVHLVLVIAAFFSGAAVSGLIIGDRVLKLGRRYGVVLILEALILVIAVPLLERSLPAGTYLAGMACGLQNAMASTYSGTVVRTSHVTGMFTDLGIFLGHTLRRLPVDARRVRISIIIISAFFSGGVAGAGIFGLMGYATLYVPAGILIVVTFLYSQYLTVDSHLQKMMDG